MTEEFNQRKANQQVRLLHQAIYAGFSDLQDMQIWHETREDHRDVPPVDADWQPVKVGDTWSGRDDYYWLRFKVQVHASKASETVLRLDLGRTGEGNNSGFEALLFLNGKPRQAVDSNHEEVFLGPEYDGQTVDIQIMMWTGLEGGGPKKIQHYVFTTAQRGPERRTVRRAYRYLSNIVNLIPELSEDNPLRYDYIRLVKHAFKGFFWATATPAETEQDAEQALSLIDAFIAKHQNEKLDFAVDAIGQTHIDVAWLWRYRHTREKARRSFATALRLMDRYPDFKFFYSTPQVHKFVEEDDPEMFKQIQARAAEGRWEPDGGTWLEPDTNLPSGEALVRQFLYGTRYFEQKFHHKQTVMWLPDVFGYSYALPQIMQGFGIKRFVTIKISWNDTNRMPHDLFMWTGLDGSRVLTQFLTTVERTEDYSQSKVWNYTYNGEISPHVVMGSYHEYKDKDKSNVLLMPYGFGDGGGGPTKEMIENLHVIDALPGLPHAKNKTVADFFNDLEQSVKGNEETYPEWNGELYLEFHRGTYTSQAKTKRNNRKLELALRRAEILATTALVEKGTPYPKAEFDRAWEILLRNQFHDVLPGSAIGEAYEDVDKLYAEAFDLLAKITAARTAETSGIELSNPLLGEKAAAFVPEKQAGEFKTAAGTTVQAKRLGTGYVLPNVTVPALGTTALTFTPIGEAAAPTPSQTNQIETPHYLIKWNAAGQLTSVYDKDNDREAIKTGGLGNVLTIYEDRPTSFSNWNIDADYPDKSRTLSAESITTYQEAAGCRVVFKYRFDQSTVTQTLIAENDSRRLDFKTTADWHQHELLLRTSFDLNVLTDQATYDIQFGNIQRSVARNTSWEQAKFEVVGHQWADFSQRNFGVALLNDSKYGYAATDRGLSLSLIKCGVYPDTDADQGLHEFTYSLLPHRGDFIEGRVAEAAADLNDPVVVRQNAASGLTPLFTFEKADAVQVDAIKASEDGDAVILRLHNNTPGDTQLRISPTFAFASAERVELDESPVAELTAGDDGAFDLALKPYQILTVAFKRN
ncbi:glycoside hydrolase family 38 C-terminal domain-containing protein [Lacticaseibacillus sp. 53-4]|uniref:alpha-mannosidase n=1 Tax=Lacticaseibacillus sp. 53-4 TaxID=2799575 RepID=UPI0019410BA6|nr:glycoside hydrolase family 38 C-terminal domain-containing protein [Lacticaseibacillus sp. 53-4]